MRLICESRHPGCTVENSYTFRSSQPGIRTTCFISDSTYPTGKVPMKSARIQSVKNMRSEFSRRSEHWSYGLWYNVACHLYYEDEGSRFFWILVNYRQDYTASQPRRRKYRVNYCCCHTHIEVYMKFEGNINLASSWRKKEARRVKSEERDISGWILVVFTHWNLTKWNNANEGILYANEFSFVLKTQMF
jgi:hypothetical protein